MQTLTAASVQAIRDWQASDVRVTTMAEALKAPVIQDAIRMLYKISATTDSPRDAQAIAVAYGNNEGFRLFLELFQSLGTRGATPAAQPEAPKYQDPQA